MTVLEEGVLRGRAGRLDGRAWAALAAAALIVGLSLALALYRLTLPYDGYTLWLDAANRASDRDGLLISGGESELLAVEERYAAEIVAGALALSPRPPEGWRIGETLTYRFQNAVASYEGRVWLRRGPWRPLRANPLDLVFLTYIGVAAFAFARRPRSPAAQLLLLYAALQLGELMSRSVTGGWSELRLADLFDPLAFWPTLMLNSGMFGWAALIHFALIVPRPRPWLARAPWLAPLALYVLPALWLVGAAGWSVASGRPLAFFAAAFWPQLLLIAVGVPLALWGLWRSYSGATDALERAQARWVGLGMGLLFGWLGLLLASFALAGSRPLGGWIEGLYALAPLALLAPPLGIAVAFIRYRLFDEEVAAAAQRLTAGLRRSRELLVAAREEERRRLRRDLHDGLGPTLAGLTLKVDAARNTLARDPAAADALLVELRGQIQGAVGEIRRLVYGLRPPALDQLGFVGALAELADQCGPGLAVEVSAPDELPPLPAAVEVAAYRIAQEALTNAMRHSGAASCELRVGLAGGDLELVVEDDGAGIGAGRQAGVGLAAMVERAEELGGRCAVEPSEEGGTRVRALLPL